MCTFGQKTQELVALAKENVGSDSHSGSIGSGKPSRPNFTVAILHKFFLKRAG